MSEKEIDAMVYNKHLDIIKGVVAPAIMTENYLQAYREGIKDTLRKMMKDSVEGVVSTNIDGWINVQTGFVRPEEVGNVNFGDKAKLIIIKED